MHENAGKLKFSKYYKFRVFGLNRKFPIADFVSDRMKYTLHASQNYSFKSKILFQTNRIKKELGFFVSERTKIYRHIALNMRYKFYFI